MAISAAWGLNWDESGDANLTVRMQKSFGRLLKSSKVTSEQLILKELGSVHTSVSKEAMYFRNPAITDDDKSKSYIASLCVCVCLFVSNMLC